jgi:hypothetical protein
MAVAQGTRSTVMFVVGVTMALGAGGLMFFTEIDTGPLTVIGIIGIMFIAVGGVRSLDRRSRVRHEFCLRAAAVIGSIPHIQETRGRPG